MTKVKSPPGLRRVQTSAAGRECYWVKRHRTGWAWPQLFNPDRFWVLWDGHRVPEALHKDLLEPQDSK
jgi:hypothetical protein